MRPPTGVPSSVAAQQAVGTPCKLPDCRGLTEPPSVACAALSPQQQVSSTTVAEGENNASLLEKTMDQLLQAHGSPHTDGPDASAKHAPKQLSQAGRPLEPLNRIIVVGKLAEGVPIAELVASHEQVLRGKDATGLLLLLPSGGPSLKEDSR